MKSAAVLLALVVLACGSPSSPDGSVTIVLTRTGDSDQIQALQVTFSFIDVVSTQGRGTELPVADPDPNDCYKGSCWLILDLFDLPAGGRSIASGTVRSGSYDQVRISPPCDGVMILGDSLRLGGELLMPGRHSVHLGCGEVGNGTVRVPSFSVASAQTVEVPIQFDLIATLQTFRTTSVGQEMRLVFR